jgi:MoxR-like ATPase
MAVAKAKAKPVAPDDFERIARWLTTEVVVERDLEMRVLTRVALAGLNAHMIGAPGVAKSLVLREFSRCVLGARYFEKVVHGMLPADAVIGGYDMPRFAATGEFVRNVEHYAPNAHIIFLDELPRANGPMLDSVLPLMNTQERKAEHNGGMQDCPTLFVVTASNSWFDPENQQAQALSDRVSVMMKVEDVKSDDSFREILRRDHDRRLKIAAGSQTRETLTLEQVQDAQRQVKEVRLSPEFLDSMAKLRRECTQEGIAVSPRRWVELALLCRANAWMSNRDHTIPEDLAIVEHGLWRDQDDIATAHKLVLQYHGRFEREASKFRQEAAKHIQQVEKIRAQVEGTPPNEELEQDVLTSAISASRAIDAAKARVEAVLKEADKEQRDAASLRELDNELLSIQMWFDQYNLPTEYSKRKGA